MKKHMILFSVGKDREGIVYDVSTFLFKRNANIEDSRMAAMGRRFCSTVLFSCTPSQLDAIRADMGEFESLGLAASLHEAEAPGKEGAEPSLPLKIQAVALDHPGIVQSIVQTLHKDDVNITTLTTSVKKAPLSGAPLFDLTLEAEVPAAKPIAKVKDALSSLAARMNIDLIFKN